MHYSNSLPLIIACYASPYEIGAVLSHNRAGKIKISGTRKSVLLKASSGERFAPHDFMLLVKLVGTPVSLIVYLSVHQMK